MATTVADSPDNSDCRRFERKFVTVMAPAEVEAIVMVHPAMFVRTYPPRHVNNIYCDTPGLACYHDNLEGHNERLKVRVRWYGRLRGCVGRGMLEMKSRRGLLGRKSAHRLPPFDFDGWCPPRRWLDMLAGAGLPTDERQRWSALRPTLVNRYYRRYFETADRRFRLTIDSQLTFFPVQSPGRIMRQSSDRRRTIIELKYDAALDEQAGCITSRLPFRISRNSKYVTGLESIWGYRAACPPSMITAPDERPAPPFAADVAATLARPDRRAA